MSVGFHRPSSRGTVKNHVRDEVELSTSAQVQNVRSGRVYVFGNTVCEEDEENGDIEMPELRARGTARRQFNGTTVDQDDSEPSYFERTLSKEDTLLSIALKYGCKVAELKRLNNLIKDQDFYALKALRIPLCRHGLLTELIKEEEQRQGKEKESQLQGAAAAVDANVGLTEANSSGLRIDHNEEDEDEDQDGSLTSDSERQALLVQKFTKLSIRDSLGAQSREASDFLKRMDSDIRSIVAGAASSRKETLDEVRETLTCRRIQPLTPRRKLLDGVDCGMRWWSVLLTMLTLLVGGPLIYFLYIELVKPGS